MLVPNAISKCLFVIFVETSYLNTAMCKFESLQKENGGLSAVPTKLAANLELLIIVVCFV